MKFSKLVDKFEKLVDKYEKGRQIKPQKLIKLEMLLDEKKTRYQAKLDATEDPGKRKKIQTKLNIVSAQIEKARKLSTAG